jgi:peroxiredoxin
VQRNDRFENARRRARLQTIAMLAAALAGALVYPLIAHGTPAVGAAAPDFVLKDLAGHNLRLSEYRGDVVVLSFWASWCAPCRDALSQLNAMALVQDGSTPVVLSVNIEGDAARAASVAESLQLKFPTLVDAKQSVGRQYDVEHLPLTLLVDRDGVVRGVWSKQPAQTSELSRQIKELESK